MQMFNIEWILILCFDQARGHHWRTAFSLQIPAICPNTKSPPSFFPVQIIPFQGWLCEFLTLGLWRTPLCFPISLSVMLSIRMDSTTLVSDYSLSRRFHCWTEGKALHLRIPSKNPALGSDGLRPKPVLVVKVTLEVGDLKPEIT